MSPALVGAILAGLSGSVLVAGWLLYPVGLALRARSARRSQGGPAAASSRPLTAVVATREDPSVIAQRVRNLRSSSYPAGELEILVAVDHRSPHDPAQYRRVLDASVTVIPGDPPGGKATALNAGVRAATGEIVLFADSHQRYASDAIGQIVACFADPAVGAVTGAYRPRQDPSRLLRWFWQYEMMLRRLETRVHSVVAVTGAIYAVRRGLWVPLPPHAICDDLFVPARVVFAGHRVVSCDTAEAVDPRRFSRAHEMARKVRTLTGMIQFCLWEPRALSPRGNPIWIQFMCHKLLRLATPILLTGVVIGVALLGTALPAGFLWVAAAVGAGALILLASSPSRGRKALSELAWMLLLLGAPLKAFRNALRGEWDVWRANEPHAAESPSPIGRDGP